MADPWPFSLAAHDLFCRGKHNSILMTFFFQFYNRLKSIRFVKRDNINVDVGQSLRCTVASNDAKTTLCFWRGRGFINGIRTLSFPFWSIEFSRNTREYFIVFPKDFAARGERIFHNTQTAIRPARTPLSSPTSLLKKKINLFVVYNI